MSDSFNSLRPDAVYLVGRRVPGVRGGRERALREEAELARELLPDDELARARRMTSPGARRQFVAGRLALRSVLASVTGTAPKRIRFRYQEHGKPFLPGGPSFSVSHSGDRVLVAVAAQGRIGVDIEAVRRVRRMAAVVRRRFAPEEAAWWAGQAKAARRGAFFRIWARKEAFAKAVGGGLTVPFRSFSVLPAGRAEVGRAEIAGERRECWSVRDVPAGPNRSLVPEEAAAAVAADWPGAAVYPLQHSMPVVELEQIAPFV